MERGWCFLWGNMFRSISAMNREMSGNESSNFFKHSLLFRHQWTRFPIWIRVFSRLKPPNLHQKNTWDISTGIRHGELWHPACPSRTRLSQPWCPCYDWSIHHGRCHSITGGMAMAVPAAPWSNFRGQQKSLRTLRFQTRSSKCPPYLWRW